MSLDITPAEAALARAVTTTELPDRILYIMAAACGACAANIFYNQPLLSAFSTHFHATSAQVSLVATAASVGYGIGMFFLVPLGDILERRRIILLLVAACAVLLVAAAFSPTLALLVFLQFLIGVTAMSAQLLIPLAVDLTPPARRGHTIGILMGGLLSGVLLARTLAGLIADHLSWQAVFLTAAGIMTTLYLALHRSLPHSPPAQRSSYPSLMRSLLALPRTTPALIPSCLITGFSFAGFIAFWTSLSFLMRDTFHRGATEAGLFGLVGLAGALAAPLAGKLSDRRSPNLTTTLALLLSLFAFALMYLWVSFPSLIAGVLLMDLGAQSVQVSEQSRVMALPPATARNRLNTLYMVSRFTGGAAGAYLSALAYTHSQWPGVSLLALSLTAAALLTHLLRPSQQIDAAPITSSEPL